MMPYRTTLCIAQFFEKSGNCFGESSNLIHEQMIQMGKHADLSFLWIDYKKEHPNGYQLAQFYKLYRDFMVDTYGTSKTSMPVERIPGEKTYIDWVGDQLELLLDTTTGELRKVHIFTTTA